METGRRAYEGRQYTVAAAEFERALAVCDDRNRVLLPLAQAQLLAQRLQDSLATLDVLLKSEARNVDGLKLRGDVLYLLAREADAERSLRSALVVDPKHEASRYALGRMYYQQSRFPEATELFQGLIADDPKNFRAHDNLALCYAAVRRDADALRHFAKALELVHKDHREYDTAYANAANFLMERGQDEKAFQLAAEASERNPDSARNFFLTGKALVRLGKDELSIRWFRRAAELDPKYTEPRYWLARVYRKLGRNEDAARELAAFRELSKAPRLQR